MAAPHRITLPFPWRWGVLLGALLLVLYFCNERSCLHRGAAERIFWPFVYAWFALMWVLRPVAFAAATDEVGHVTVTDSGLIVLAALLGCAVYSHNQRQRMAGRLSRATLRQLAQTLDIRGHVETVPARVATARLTEVLGAEGGPPGFFGGLAWEVWGALTGRRLRAQGKVFGILRDGQPADLLYVLNSAEVDLALLLATAGSRDVMALVIQLVPAMDVVTKARLVDALHRHVDFVHLSWLQRPVVSILTQTHGQELTVLKNLIDEMGGFYSLHKLVFRALLAELRSEVLAHVEREGRTVRRSVLRDRGGREVLCQLPRKILSDIDDTFFSSGAHFPAGLDSRFPKKQIYPGVLAFLLELDRSVAASVSCAGDAGARHAEAAVVPLWVRYGGAWVDMPVPGEETVAVLQRRLRDARQAQAQSQKVTCDGEDIEVRFSPPVSRPTSNLAFLSARPHMYKDYVESTLYNFFRGLCDKGSLHCMPTLLAGDLGSSARAAAMGALLLFRPHLILALAILCAWALHVQQHCAVCLALVAAFLTTSLAAHRRRRAIWQPVGVNKAKTFREYQQLYPEFALVFIGDNGQGDLLCAELLAEPPPGAGPCDGSGVGHPEAPLATFIHEVAPRAAQLTSMPLGRLDSCESGSAWESLRIYFHRTYIGAAVNAYGCGLISADGLARVARAAVDDLVRMRVSQLWDVRRAWADRVAELNADVDRANEVLPPELAVEPVPEAAGSFGATCSPSKRAPSARSSPSGASDLDGLQHFSFGTSPGK